MNQSNQNLAASVRQKLQNFSQQQKDDFQSPYQNQFILKGAFALR